MHCAEHTFDAEFFVSKFKGVEVKIILCILD